MTKVNEPYQKILGKLFAKQRVIGDDPTLKELVKADAILQLLQIIGGWLPFYIRRYRQIGTSLFGRGNLSRTHTLPVLELPEPKRQVDLLRSRRAST